MGVIDDQLAGVMVRHSPYWPY